MTAAGITALLREFGLPTVFAVWLMWLITKRIDRVIDLVGKLVVIIVVLAKIHDIDVEKVLEENGEEKEE